MSPKAVGFRCLRDKQLIRQNDKVGKLLHYVILTYTINYLLQIKDCRIGGDHFVYALAVTQGRD